MQRLQKFAAECNAQPPKSKDGTNSIYGANFSCKISAWLAMGCLSPRHMFDEMKKTASRYIQFWQFSFVILRFARLLFTYVTWTRILMLYSGTYPSAGYV